MCSYISKNTTECFSEKKKEEFKTVNEINILGQLHISPENSTRRIGKECS